MSHIVDINRGKIKEAIADLGINPDLLIIKTLEDFIEDDITVEVARIRFGYYTRKQQELANMIAKQINKSQPRIKINCLSKANTFMTQASDQKVRNNTEGLDEIKERQKKRLVKSLKEIEKTFLNALEIDKKIELSREAKQKALSTKSTRKNIFEQLKLKQMENLKIIRKAEAGKSIKIPRLGSLTPMAHRNFSGDFSTKDEGIAESSEKELHEKIKKIEEKMKKSQALHDMQINKKKEAAVKLLGRVPRNRERSLDNESEKIIRLISKHEANKERRQNLMASSNAKRRRMNSKIEKRFNNIKAKKSLLQFQRLKDQEFQVKMAKSEQTIKSKQED